jgi:hypothetical protein
VATLCPAQAACALQVCCLTPSISSSQIQRVIEECQIREQLRSQRELDLLSQPRFATPSLSVATDYKSPMDASTASSIGRLQPFCKGTKHVKLREPLNSLAYSWGLSSSPASVYQERQPSRGGQASRGSSFKPRHSLQHRQDLMNIRCKSANISMSDTKGKKVTIQSHSTSEPLADIQSLWQGVP